MDTDLESSYNQLIDFGPDPDFKLNFLLTTSSVNPFKTYSGQEPEVSHCVNISQSSVHSNGKGQGLLKYLSLKRLFNKKRHSGRMKGICRLLDTKATVTSFKNWRKGAIAAAITTGLITLINTIFVILGHTKFDVQNGIGNLYTGDCTLVRQWNMALHVLINLLGTLLLAASNFTMQCLSSPTRREVDVAHAKRISLEVGLQSFKNLFHVERWKSLVWFALCFSTMPLHLFWNSTIFFTKNIDTFAALVVTEGFFNGSSYQTPQIPQKFPDDAWSLSHDCTPDAAGDADLTDIVSMMYSDYKANGYSLLSDCLDFYTESEPQVGRNLFVVVEQPKAGDKMGQCGYDGQLWNGSSLIALRYNISPGTDWLPAIIDTFNGSQLNVWESNSKGTWLFGNFTIKSCLADSKQATYCQLQFVPYILYIVLGCNLVKLVSMCVAINYLWNLNEPIFATIGDATASFLEHPDDTIQGLCLLDYRAVNSKTWRDSLIGVKAYNPVYHRKPQRRLHSATTNRRWWCMMTPCILYLLIGFTLWGMALRVSALFDVSLQDTMAVGFGTGDSLFTLGVTSASTKSSGEVIAQIAIANSFQLALSTTYFLYNSLYTAQCAALEWASYVGGSPKPLRVTSPRGQQRSRYYLQLPYRYAIPLTILSALLHFLVSQSVFVVRILYIDWKGMDMNESVADVGYSARAILTTCLVGVAVLLAQIANAYRPLDNRIPAHGNNSAVISAVCHVELVAEHSRKGKDASTSTTDLDNIAFKPITWGVTRKPRKSVNPSDGDQAWELEEDGAGHCTFSIDTVELPEIGSKYR